MKFYEFFKKATGEQGGPFPFQCQFAEDFELPALVNVPTGLGKTAMVIIGWLWQRYSADTATCNRTPRRLVYCLPMRVLVEQTRDNAERWLGNLRECGLLDRRIQVDVLMGGEDEHDWDIHPECDAVIIGTQDMLLSRALNRGYAASRARWPMQFGLLHTDCLWVFDEIQLMGSGLATTSQLEAFRRLLPNPDSDDARNAHGCRSVWMSATLEPSWLETVDFKRFLPEEPRLIFDFNSEIASPEIDPEAKKALVARWKANKLLSRATSTMGDHAALAEDIVTAHSMTKGRTIVVVNTVKRACDLNTEIESVWPDANADNLILVHSRFRPPDRAAQLKKLRPDTPPEHLPGEGMIVVSTQVIEAGVDVSATTLFTELAPWASLVQRFGRCNRLGEQNACASVRWIDLPDGDADAEKVRFPYELEDLRAASAQLKGLDDVGLDSLASNRKQLDAGGRAALFPYKHTHVIRKRDLIDLFDTTPDLAGNDIDIDRFVREVEETDVRVFWREWERPKGFEPPPDDKAWRRPVRDELCPTRVGEFRDFATKGKAKGAVWHWDFTEGQWRRVADKNAIYPGQTYLIHASAGGYDPVRGWIGAKGGIAVTPIKPAGAIGLSDDAYDDDGLSKADRWQSIAEHTDDVCRELDVIVEALVLEAVELAALRAAARWHDWGKAHKVFQSVLPQGVPTAEESWAKASGAWKKYKDVKRPHFRHELASALGVLLPDTRIGDADRDIVAYLIAAHHGKVRLSIRSMPNEARPPADHGAPRRFARGIWDGDALPRVDLGGGVVAPSVALSLEPMEIGLCEQPPFAGQPSWAERMIRLRDKLGPFRLAFLEAQLRAADWRASAKAELHKTSGDQTAVEVDHA